MIRFIAMLYYREPWGFHMGFSDPEDPVGYRTFGFGIEYGKDLIRYAHSLRIRLGFNEYRFFERDLD